MLSALFVSNLFQNTTLAQGILTGITGDYAPYEYEKEEGDLLPKAILKIRNNNGNIDQLTGTTATVFTFDGNSSVDSETSAHLLEVRFDFENDGKLDTYFSVTKTAKHQYKTPGWKTVRMDVLDRAGNVSSVTEKIYIVLNTPPEAYFTISPKIGTPGTIFKIDTSKSSDSQYSKNLLKYRFDFDGDGLFDTKSSKTRYYKHKFDEPGFKKVTLETRDPEGATSIYQQLVYIKENTPPFSSFKVITKGVDSKKASYLLDASSSYDKDSSKLKYKWDFNYTGLNDIQWNTQFSLSPRAYANFYKSGEYIIKLLVKDEDGDIATSCAKIFVNLLK